MQIYEKHLTGLLTGPKNMIKELMHDPIFLAGKSDFATLSVADSVLRGWK